MITISHGHWAIGTGARAIIDEVEESRKVSERVTQLLESSGIRVKYIEDNVSKNKQQNLAYLVSQHNKSDRELDVSIHFNSSSGNHNRGIGTEVLYYDAHELAAKMSAAIASVSGLINRGAKQRKELAFLSKTNKAAILLEICFVNSSVDVALYRRDFEKICRAIATTLISHVAPAFRKDDSRVNKLRLLTETGRNEIRALLKSSRSKNVISSVHTDAKIESYSDIELLSYQAAVINRTFK